MSTSDAGGGGVVSLASPQLTHRRVAPAPDVPALGPRAAHVATQRFRVANRVGKSSRPRRRQRRIDHRLNPSTANPAALAGGAPDATVIHACDAAHRIHDAHGPGADGAVGTRARPVGGHATDDLLSHVHPGDLLADEAGIGRRAERIEAPRGAFHHATRTASERGPGARRGTFGGGRRQERRGDEQRRNERGPQKNTGSRYAPNTSSRARRISNSVQ